mmetsp:Transcript_100203/g.269140  ORF Transcript_100203/g.269140 Transcript_100203/m.269140 type:complete len:485 (+) Transcript_100203:3-1457(+)
MWMCASIISDKFSVDAKMQVVGHRSMKCAEQGLASLMSAGCPEGSCYSMVELDIPFSFSSCASSQSEACTAWKWLHCAFPDDSSSGAVMHSYFFVGGSFEGNGFAFAEKDVAGLLKSAGADVVAGDLCAKKFPQAATVANGLWERGASKGIVLFGWDGCPCTAIAQSRFAAASLCFEQLTWQNPSSELMDYLQCREGDPTHHSFVYIRDAAGVWKFRGSGFAFDAGAMSDKALEALAQEGSVARSCLSEFSVNIYGETLSECRAASADSSGSWMWDGKCTETGGGVHQICMSQLPADFSVTTGQGPWSEDRANQRHCVCIGAWSLYMTREADPAWTTSSAWPFCDAVPMSALTAQCIAKWKEWNGIPARIAVGATKILEKCLMHRNGPGSPGPSETGACRLLKAFQVLQKVEGAALSMVNMSKLESDHGLNCTDAASAVPQSTASEPSTGGATASKSTPTSASFVSPRANFAVAAWLRVLGTFL